MPAFKRKGKTFITEHYVKEKYLDVFVKVIASYVAFKRKNDKHNNFLRYLERADEIGIWADPRGLYVTAGMSLPKTPIEWKKLDIDMETIQNVLMAMHDAYQDYGENCGYNYSFKIVLNENTFCKIAALYKI